MIQSPFILMKAPFALEIPKIYEVRLHLLLPLPDPSQNNIPIPINSAEVETPVARITCGTQNGRRTNSIWNTGFQRQI